MDFNGNFRLINQINIDHLKKQIQSLPLSQWLQDDFRQRQFKTHRSTQTIPLIFDADFRYTKPTVLPAFNAVEQAISPVLLAASSQLDSDHYLLRLLLTRLSAGERIPPHQDKGQSLVFVHRMHLAVETHPNVRFRVGKDTQFMAQGEIWEINNCRTHSVSNDSEVDRIHLIMDWVTPTLARQYLQQQRFATL